MLCKPRRLAYLIYFQCEQIFESTHTVPITCAKLSILFFYRRIFRGKVFSAIIWATIMLAVAWGSGYFFTLLFMCTPTSLYVHQGSSTPGVHCVNRKQVYYSLAMSDFLIDIIILIIPWPFIWKLHMPLRHKIAITGIFLLGFL